MFTREQKNQFTVILVYVDDMMITGTSLEQINEVKGLLNREFTIKVM